MTIPSVQIAQVVAGLLVAAVALATARSLLGASRAAPRPRAWRLLALLGLQAASAALLWLTLEPPSRPVDAGTLVVLTARADGAGRHADGEFVVALPEAGVRQDSERVPDLASALRSHPGVDRVLVIGEGLPVRDQPAVDGRALDFAPAPLPRGLVGLWSPPQVTAGALLAVHGRVHEVPGGRVELLDPSGKRSASAGIDADGRFSLESVARSAGLASFRVRLLDHNRREIEAAEVPVEVVAGAARRVLFLAGGPSPELKFLRRWAADAGLALQSRIDVGGGVDIGDGAVPFDQASLGQYDLVVLDERAWASLGGPRHAALRQAVRAGLGVLVRIEGVPSAEARSRLRAIGFGLEAARVADDVRLPGADPGRGRVPGAGGSGPPAAAGDEALPVPALSRQPLRPTTGDGSVLLADAGGEPLAAWRAEGQGRVGVTVLGDTYRLVLSGHAGRHAQLWSDAFTVLGRARGARQPYLKGDARQGERVVVCGLAGATTVVPPVGPAMAALPDPRRATGSCAGVWPRVAGWHELATGGDAARWRFHVRARDELPGVRALALREATSRLATDDVPRIRDTAMAPGPRWPWFLGWLVATSLLWWLERSRAGVRAGDPSSAGPTEPDG